MKLGHGFKCGGRKKEEGEREEERDLQQTNMQGREGEWSRARQERLLFIQSTR